MKQGWEIKKLEELAIKLFAGGDKPKVFSEHPTDVLNIPVYANGVSFDGLVGYTDKATVEKESITVSARGTIGFCCVRRTPFVPIVRLITIIPIESIKTEFLYYALSNATIENNGVAIPQLTIPMIKGITIPIPSLAEQEKIVAELDCLSGVIEKKREQLKELDALAESIFYTMFGDPITNEKGWEVKKLGDIATSQIGITYKPENVTDNGEGVVVLRSSNIQDSTLCFEDIVRVDCAIKENKYVKDGDILMCTRNGSFRLVGKVAMIANMPERMTYGAFMTIIRSDNQSYLFAFFKSPAFRSQLTTSKTATINQITVKMLDEIKVALPPITLQQEFAEKIEAIEKQKELIKESIKETETLFNARMDYYFNS